MAKLSLYPFQREAVEALLSHDKHFIVANVGMGKSAIMLKWLEERTRLTAEPDKPNWLIITTPAKARSGDFLSDLESFTDYTVEDFKRSGKLTIISWYGLFKLLGDKSFDTTNLLVAFDEVHKGSGANLSGVSRMSKAFVALAKNATDFIGLTATPGDSWSKFCAYFMATGRVRNKSLYYSCFAITQDFKGFREITGWRDEGTLREWWGEISYAPDTSEAERQLPSERHNVINFGKPKGYDKVRKTRIGLDDTVLDTPGKMISALRNLTGTHKDKLEWLTEFIENQLDPVVIFMNLKAEEEAVYELAKKALKARGDNAPIFRIDGTHREIPTEETINGGVVICHYLSGGEALNLQFMHLWVSLSPNYSYSASVQARGRVQRIGQKHPVSYYYLTCKGTIDEDIYKILKTKKDFKEENWVI